MNAADVHDLVAKLHRGRSQPLGRCACMSCQTARVSNAPLRALEAGLRAAAAQQEDYVISRDFVPLLLAALEAQ
jgi:hypothetical protein